MNRLTRTRSVIAKTHCAKHGVVYREEGVIVSRSAFGFRIYIPSPCSSHHQFCIAGALWEAWDSIRGQVMDSGVECVVDVEAIVDLPLPLIVFLFSMDRHLNQVGRHVRMVGGRQQVFRAMNKT